MSSKKKKKEKEEALGLDEEEEKTSPSSIKEEYISLVSREGHEILVKKEVAIVSGTIKTMLESGGSDNHWGEAKGGIISVQFDTISTKALEQVVQYFHYIHKNKGRSPPYPKFEVPQGMNELIDLVSAAHFLDC